MDAPKAARIAFVGAGVHATESLYPNIPQIPEFELVAVCDRIAEKASTTARQYGAPEAFTEVETMLDRARPDGVCICGPAEMHYEVGLQVLRRGIPLFMEKPPAPSPEQAQELADLARARNTWGMVGFMKRFAAANVVAKEFASGEEFGQLSTITLMHGAGPYQDPRRMMYYNAIHMLDLARFLAGDVDDVSAFTYSDGGRTQAVCANLRFATGALGQLNMNSGHEWNDCFEQVYLSGSGAGILIDASREVEVMAPSRRFAQGEGVHLFGWSGRYYTSGNMAGWAAGGHYTRGYWGELSHFARALLGQVAPTPTLDDSLAAVRLIEQILASAHCRL